MEHTAYLTYRGRCKDLSSAFVAEHPGWHLVRGWYHCPIWGAQPHWWCETDDRQRYDPTKDQFPSRGIGEYEPFDGLTTCEMCGARQPEAATVFGGNGNHPYCSYRCYGAAVL